MQDKNRIKENIIELEKQLDTLELPAFLKLQKMNVLKGLKYELIKDKNDKEKCAEVDELANQIISFGYEIIKKLDLAEQTETYKIIKSNYQFLGRRHLKEFMISIEWDFTEDMKFYDIRKIVFDEWIEELENLEYSILNGLSISAPPRTGKALSMDSNILTPNGWVKNRDIKPGDYAIGSDGKPVEILEVFPQGITDMYEITFDDRTKVKCSGDHLWTVQTRDDRKNNKKRTVKTSDMINNYLVENGKRKNYCIDYVKPVEFKNHLTEDDLHPYILGALIGDGYICHKNGDRIVFTTKDLQILKRFEKLLPKTDKIKYEKQYDYVITKKENIRNSKGYPIKSKTSSKLNEYNLYGKHSIDKFIPKKYLYSSIENRIELLRGLMDTDGSTDGSATVEFSTISKQLAEDMTELARSLGARVTKGEKIGKYKKDDGTVVECNKVYRLHMKFPINPFWLKRKSEKYVTRDMHIRKFKYISNIKKLPDEESQCIYVNSEDHLFVTDGYNLTHNTGVGTIFFMWCMLRHPEKSCFFVSHTRCNGKKSIFRHHDNAERPYKEYSCNIS